MGTFRMFADANGQSQWDEIDLSENPNWTKGLGASQIIFRKDPVGRFRDWHPASRRQFVIGISGQMEIGFSDGTKKVFGPGDARLVEDTTGTGHTVAVYGDLPCVTATIFLDDQ
jgi:hypothetical protein